MMTSSFMRQVLLVVAVIRQLTMVVSQLRVHTEFRILTDAVNDPDVIDLKPKRVGEVIVSG
jgi:hypothetical protein